jgi:hypothetical protein
MEKLARNIGSALLNFTNAYDHEGPLTKMFRTEYAKEYHQLKSMGYELNDRDVREILRSRKLSQAA